LESKAVAIQDAGFNSCYPACACGKNLGVKKSGVGAKTLPQQVINNSAAVPQELSCIRLYVYSCKLILAAIYLRRVEIDGCSYAAAPLSFQQFLCRLRLRHKVSA